jgi:hypothetical protein
MGGQESLVAVAYAAVGGPVDVGIDEWAAVLPLVDVSWWAYTGATLCSSGRRLAKYH